MRKHDGEQDLAAARAHGLGARQQNGLDILHAGRDRQDDRKHSVTHAESDFRGRADPEDDHEQRQDGRERHGVKQQNDGINGASRETVHADNRGPR